MAKTDWILGQALFWLLVVAILIAGMVGLRRAGAVLAAHQAGLVGARAALGPPQADSQARSDLRVWWGITPQQAQPAVQVSPEPGCRSLRVVVQGWMDTLLGRSAALGAGSFQRWESFYPGPPDVWE